MASIEEESTTFIKKFQKNDRKKEPECDHFVDASTVIRRCLGSSGSDLQLPQFKFNTVKGGSVCGKIVPFSLTLYRR